MGDWTDTTLEQIAGSTARAFSMGPFGSNIKAENYRESGVPIIRGINLSERGGAPFIAEDFVFLSEDEADELASASVAPNVIVFVAQGTVGKVGIVPADTQYCRFILSENTMKVTVDPKRAAPQFIFYYFRSDLGQHEIMSRVNPTGVPCISKPLTSLRQFGIRLPTDIRERQAIASILGALDDKIDLNRRMNETLEALARAIFKDWFVDFGPTRAKMEGRAPYLAPEIWALFPDRLDDDDEPEGWRIGSLTELIEVGPPEPMRKGEITPYLDMAALPTVGSTADAPVMREFSSGTRFRNSDTLLGRITPCLENGKTAFVQNLNGNTVGWGSTEFIVLRSISPVPKPVSYLIARDPAFRRYAIQSMTGTSGRQRATVEAIKAYPVAIPDDHRLWVCLENVFAPLFSRIAANAEEIETLAATRDLLLPKLMSGEIRVCNAEKELERVA
jgi:type I restriction enzyme, S subunit